MTERITVAVCAISPLCLRRSCEDTEAASKHAEKLFLRLCVIDGIRAKYWIGRAHNARKKYVTFELK